MSVITASIVLQMMVSMTTLARGVNSDIMEPRQVVVRTADDWRALWKSHSAQPPPVVDFSRSVVVAVFLGSRPTAGFAVKITAIRTEGGTAVVEYVERRPAPDALVAQVLTSPFHIVTVPRTAGDLKFRQIESIPFL